MLAGMANCRRQSHVVNLEYVFDRLLAKKLEQVYEILVPDQVRELGVGATSGLRNGETHEDSSDIRSGIFRQTTGGEDHRQSDGDLGDVCKKQRLQRAR
jgi:hypothetical protein